MIQLDAKEAVMLRHYQKLFDNYSFDEFDILGFLMLVRRFIQSGYICILEFADLVAHRFRDRGRAMTCISSAIDNNYETYNGKIVKGYHGIDECSWRTEWQQLFSDLCIALNERLLKEITICIFSLAHGSEYMDVKGHHGYLILGRGKNNTLALSTTEGNSDSLYVCFCLLRDIDFNQKREDFLYQNPVETERINGKLRLKDENGYII